MRRDVKKLYNGCIDLIDHNVKLCIEKNENYQVFHNNDMMTLTPEELKTKCVGKQRIDKPAHGNKPYRLLSYEWTPDKVEL